MRNMSMALTSTRLPVGVIPWNSPRWVPRMTTRAATRSPSAITSSMVIPRSGKPSRASEKVSLKVSMSLTGGSWGRRSLSGAFWSTISAARSKSPVETISYTRLTMALFSSVMLVRLPRCLRSCPILRHSRHKVAFGQRRPHHLCRGRTLKSVRGGVHPAAECVPCPIRHGKQIAAVDPYRWTAGEPEASRLRVCVDSDHLDLGLKPLLGENLRERLVGRPVGRASVEVQHLYPHGRTPRAVASGQTYHTA